MSLSLGGLSEVRIMHSEEYRAVIFHRWSFRGKNYAHLRISRCHCPQVVPQGWELCTLKDIKLLLSSVVLSEVRIMHTEGY